MGPELEYPECLSPSEVREDTEKKLPAEWYSYYLGNTTLAKVTIPLQWDESAQEVTLNGGLDWKEYDLTRVFKYRIGHLVYPPPGKGARVPIVVYDTPQEECEETVPVRMLVAVVPGETTWRWLEVCQSVTSPSLRPGSSPAPPPGR